MRNPSFTSGTPYLRLTTFSFASVFKDMHVVMSPRQSLPIKYFFAPCNLSNPVGVHIYDLYAGKMYSLCHRYSGNTGFADDLFQEGIIRVYKHLSSFKAQGSFEGWARRIFVNACLDHLKRKQKMVFSELHENIDTTSTELTGITKLTQADLLKIIQQLPNGYRTIVNLYLVEEYNHREIAEMLGISEGTSKSQLSRAKTILQKNILETYGRYQ